MKQNLTEIAFILDRSGSMQSVWTDTVGGYNRFVKEQKEVPGDANFTLVAFDSEYEIIHNGIPLKDVPELPKTIGPRSMTALLDAIGRTVNTIGERLSKTPEADRPGKVVVVVSTDGIENSSTEFDFARIKEIVAHQTDKYKWQFVFLGANMDAINAGGSVGVQISNAMSTANNSVGVRSAYHSTSANLTKFRSGVVDSMAFSDDDRKAQYAAGAEDQLKDKLTSTTTV